MYNDWKPVAFDAHNAKSLLENQLRVLCGELARIHNVDSAYKLKQQMRGILGLSRWSFEAKMKRLLRENS